MKLFFFVFIIISAHIVCMLLDRNYLQYIGMKFFMRFAPSAREEFDEQFIQLRERNIKSLHVDVADRLIFKIGFRLKYFFPLFWTVTIFIGYFIIENKLGLIVYSILLAFVATSYRNTVLSSLIKRGKKIRFLVMKQLLYVKLGSLLATVVVAIALYQLFKRVDFSNTWIDCLMATVSYLLLLFGSSVQDYFIRIAKNMNDEYYTFDNIKKIDDSIILYLRSFEVDEANIYCPCYCAGSFFRYLLLPRVKFSILVTELFESTGQGFLVGIANPKERVSGSKYHGFSKTFVIDDFEGEDKWKVEIQELLSKVDRVIGIVGKTQGVSWEVETIRSLDIAKKVLLLFPPFSDNRGDIDLVTGINSQLGLSDDNFPSAFYDSQFIGITLQEYGTIWFLNFGRNYYSYIFSIFTFHNFIDKNSEFFQ